MKKNKRSLLQEKKELLARVKLQDQLIIHVEKEIYENVSQVLCLARIQLSGFDSGGDPRLAEALERSGNLIARAIIDLRNLAKQVQKI